jgi:hypothetical protein
VEGGRRVDIFFFLVFFFFWVWWKRWSDYGKANFRKGILFCLFLCSRGGVGNVEREREMVD